MWGLAFAAPALLFFCLFSIYPFIKGLSLSFFEANVFESKFVGLENFKAMFSDQYFWNGVKHTLWYTAVSVPLCTGIPLVVSAVAIRASKGFQYTIRFAFYIPQLSAGIIIASFWKWIFHPTRGLLNSMLGCQIAWLGSNPTAFWSTEAIIVASSLGGSIILYMAKMLSIPHEFFESAAVDGCGPVKATWFVTIPLLLPIISYVMIIHTIGFMQTWMIPYTMTGGGPNYGTTTLVLLIYQDAMHNGRWGYASAMSLLLMVAILVLSLIQRRFMRARW